MSLRILVTDKIDLKGLDLLRDVAQVDTEFGATESRILELIPSYDVLLIRSRTQVNKKILSFARNLKIVGRAGVGVDNVDVKSCTDRGVLVINSPSGNTISAAEHTLALMMSLSRKIAPADHNIRSLKWDKECFIGNELNSKTIGIIGMGKVGCHLGKVCRALGMNILCYDPYLVKEKVDALEAKPVQLDELFSNSDYITMHIPLNESSKNLINRDTLNKMKTTAFIINTSRGGIVNEKDLCEALECRRIAGAALDVFEVEKAFSAESILLKAPNLLLTPHLGASTVEAQKKVAIDICEQIRDFILFQKFPYSSINLPKILLCDQTEVKNILNCFEMFGYVSSKFFYSSNCYKLDSVQIIIKNKTKSLGYHYFEAIISATLKGIFTERRNIDLPDVRTNYINARLLANGTGLKVSLTEEYLPNLNGEDNSCKDNIILFSAVLKDGLRKLIISGDYSNADKKLIIHLIDGNRTDHYVMIDPRQETIQPRYMIILNLCRTPENISNVSECFKKSVERILIEDQIKITEIDDNDIERNSKYLDINPNILLYGLSSINENTKEKIKDLIQRDFKDICVNFNIITPVGSYRPGFSL